MLNSTSVISASEMSVMGKITGVYGVKGWVKIHSYTEPMENIFSYKECFVYRGGRWQSIRFTDARPHGKGLVAHIDGVDDRDQAALYSKCDLAVPLELLPALEEGEFYWRQLEGLKVVTVDEDGNELLLGTVDHLLETGANDVLVVKGCDGSIDENERLIPYLFDQFVLEVDLRNSVIRVDWDPAF